MLRSDRGQASEYAVVLALVAVGLLVALLLLRESVGRTYGRVANTVSNPGQQESGAVTSGGVSQPAGGGTTSAASDQGKGDHGDKGRDR
ncbi:MAG TPA: hypothetical protein VIE46_04545 [Gemmatimonadales bacterium]